MKTIKSMKKYIAGFLSVASLLLMMQIRMANAGGSFSSYHREVDEVSAVTIISVTDRDNLGGGKIMDILVENKDGERMILHICNSDCPQVFPNGYACPVCAACYASCHDQLMNLVGTGERVNFKVFNGYVQGHLTGDGCHCFTS